MENIYKESFIEGKKGEQRCYMTTLVIAFYCLSISFGEVNQSITLPILSIDLPLSIAQYILLGMYSTSIFWGAFYTVQSYKAALGLKECKSGKLKALSTYPSIYNAPWYWVLIAISLPFGVLSSAFMLGSNNNYLACIFVATLLSLGQLIPLLRPNVIEESSASSNFPK